MPINEHERQANLRALAGLQRSAAKVPGPFKDVMTNFITALFSLIEAKEKELDALKATIRQGEIDANTMEDRSQEAAHYNWLDDQNEKLRAELEQIKASSVEVEYIDSGTFQGGEEDCFVKGLKQAKTCFVYSPDAKPFKDEVDPEGDGCPND